MQNNSGHQVIARAAAILRILETAGSGLTIAAIARESGLPRTTVTRLIFSMQTEDLVINRQGIICLGPALLRLAAAGHLDAGTIVRPHMETLAAELHETVDLWVKRENHVILIDEIASDQELRIVASPGFSLPLHNTAPGKAILASLNDKEINDCLLNCYQEPPSLRFLSFEALLNDIAQTKKIAMAVDIEEHAKDVCAIAMFIQLGLVEQYALAVPVPTRRFHETRQTLEAALRGCVNAIEKRT